MKGSATHQALIDIYEMYKTSQMKRSYHTPTSHDYGDGSTYYTDCGDGADEFEEGNGNEFEEGNGEYFVPRSHCFHAFVIDI